MEEQWKDIIGYEGLYEISNLGRVKSLIKYKGTDERILKPLKNKKGYLQVILHKDKKIKNYVIHRLVALHFIPNDDLSKTQVNHKDENKENNNVNNLEWCDVAYNNNYGTRNERNSKSNINHPDMSKQIQQYSLDGKTLIKTFPSMHEIQRTLGFCQSNISLCCNGKYKTAYNYIWKYAE